jgi:hypothetical protein
LLVEFLSLPQATTARLSANNEPSTRKRVFNGSSPLLTQTPASTHTLYNLHIGSVNVQVSAAVRGDGPRRTE